LVPDLDAAAAEVEMRGARRVFLTIGRQELAPFGHLSDVTFLVRAIEAPDPMPLARAELVLRRGPFSLDEELDLMTSFGADALVSKNSGGTAAAAKLEAARQLILPVVMVTRPEAPAGPTVASVSEALAWCATTFPGLSLL
jgi:precorrin-6A/cobalt-precorrin-6A reductase